MYGRMYVRAFVCMWDYFNRIPLPDVPHFLEINRELPPTPQPTSTCSTTKFLYYQFEQHTHKKMNREA
jgi:hypothetical protein